MKICAKCKIEKELFEFSKNRKAKDGLQRMCRKCKNIEHREWYSKNKQHVSFRGIEYRKKNKERIDAYIKSYRKSNPGRVRAWEKKRDSRVMATPQGRLNGTMRTSIRTCLKGSKNWRKWESLVGYTVMDLRKHIEKQFKPGMSWENYGALWEIDHKIPKAVFNYENSDDIDFKRCWALKNLQPLECSINRRKKDSLSSPFQPSLNFATTG